VGRGLRDCLDSVLERARHATRSVLSVVDGLRDLLGHRPASVLGLLLGLGLVLLGHGARSAFRAGRARARHVVRSQPRRFETKRRWKARHARRGVALSEAPRRGRGVSHRVHHHGVRCRSALFPSRRE
jgi:hypothetical protein